MRDDAGLRKTLTPFCSVSSTTRSQTGEKTPEIGAISHPCRHGEVERVDRVTRYRVEPGVKSASVSPTVMTAPSFSRRAIRRPLPVAGLVWLLGGLAACGDDPRRAPAVARADAGASTDGATSSGSSLPAPGDETPRVPDGGVQTGPSAGTTGSGSDAAGNAGPPETDGADASAGGGTTETTSPPTPTDTGNACQSPACSDSASEPEAGQQIDARPIDPPVSSPDTAQPLPPATGPAAIEATTDSAGVRSCPAGRAIRGPAFHYSAARMCWGHEPVAYCVLANDTITAMDPTTLSDPAGNCWVLDEHGAIPAGWKTEPDSLAICGLLLENGPPCD